MNVLLALTASLACLVAPSLGKECGPVVNSFTAITFDTIRFTSQRSYHAVPEGLTRYVNYDDNGETLWDFNNGDIWVREADGSCVRYQNADLAIRNPAIAAKMSVKPMPLTSDGKGNVQTGNDITTGKLEIRNRVTAFPECYGTFIDLWVDKVQRWAEYYMSPRPLTAAEIQGNKDALTQFKAAKCKVEKL